MIFTIDITESDDYIKFDAVISWCETHDIPYNMKMLDDGIHLTSAMPEMELGHMLTFIKEDGNAK